LFTLAQVLTVEWITELTRDVPYLFIRTVVMFVVVMAVVRWTGKRTIANMAPFDLAVVILIGEVAAIPISEVNLHLVNGLVPVVMLGLLHVLMTTINLYSKRFEAMTEGKPTKIVQAGKVIKSNMMKERVSMEDLKTALRHHDVVNIERVDEAWVEHAGGISVILKPDEDPATPKDIDAAIEKIVEQTTARLRAELKTLLNERPPGREMRPTDDHPRS